MQKRETRLLDKGWLIAFWINFIISLVFMIVIATVKFEESGSTKPSNVVAFANRLHAANDESTTIDEDVDRLLSEVKKTLLKAVGVGVGVGLGLTIIHFFYMTICPRFYIKFGIWLEVFLICGFCILPFFFNDDKTVGYLGFGFAGLVLLIAICVYCCCLKNFIEFTCLVFEMTVRIEKSHPAIFFVVFIQIIIQFIASLIYVTAFVFIAINRWSYYIYIYYLLCYYWVISTNYYVFYLISANLAANCYFLEGTPYLPNSIVWESVKKSTTKTFGSAAFAGFIAAIMSTLRQIAKQLGESDNAALKILSLLALCILCCLEAIFHHISRYGLFYVTVYNVPFLEGARRFTEISVKKFITTFFGECILDKALTFNSFIFAILALAIGVLISYVQYRSYMDAGDRVPALITIIFYPIIVLIFTEVFLWCLLNPADTITYALLICFTEFPERLKQVNTVQYDFFTYRYACSTARGSKNEQPQRPRSIS